LSRTDLHPDHLLARRRAGLLTPEESALLDRHVARCATCAFEVAAGQDFARDLAAPIDAAALATITAGVLRRLDTDSAPVTPPMPIAPVSRGVFRRRGIVFLAAAFIASAALAAAFVVRRPAPRGGGPARTVAPVAPRPFSPSPPAPVHPAPPTAPTAPSVPVVTAPRLASTSEAIARPRHRRPAHAAAAVAAQPDARALFEQALAARREGQYALAASLFERLQHRYGDSEEASISQIALGRLFLDRLGQPARALAQFESYLAARRHGESREEAMVGRAVALERLGRIASALEAWEAVRAAFPGSVSARRAAARIDALR